ncbi:MAG: cell division control protein Cdc6 [Thermoprotei archaeon]|nr:MAG: cell division control protein Cdc6 [Thermoprotei archaeon]RLF00596.1 MAG: cell division control protein Cdc6 [Thermoprotei archaeon]
MDTLRSLEEIFVKFSKPRIFRARELLLPDYVPEDLPHREKQILKLGSLLAPAMAGSRPSNIFIYGLPGTGKTAVTKYVLRKMLEKAGDRIQATYVNCRQNNTNYSVLFEICTQLGEKVPFTGLSLAELFKRMRRKIDSKASLVIVVLDEVDHLVKKNGDDLLYYLTRINLDLTRAKVSVIGVTNDLKFMEYLDARVKSSLCEEEIVFPPYTYEELEDILKKRAEQALNPGSYTEEAIRLCAAIAARQKGDCRLALDILLKAADLAELEGAPRIEENHVSRAYKELEKDVVVDLVKTMPLHAKLVLLSIIHLTKEKPKIIITGDVYRKYKDLCKKIGLDALTQRRVSDILSDLDTVGLISTKIVSLGRYGRTKRIKIAASEKAILEGIKEDPTVSTLLPFP